MSISQTLLPEFEQEAALTRKVLERIPEDKLDYKPHPKSMTLGRLAGHVAELSGWVATTLETPSLNITPDMKPMSATTTQKLLEDFDRMVAAAKKAMEAASDEHWMEPWSLQFDGKTVFTLPRVAVVRAMAMNHTIHHRAQLGVYLRLNDIPVPSTYGPSADEGAM